jgi:lysozyme
MRRAKFSWFLAVFLVSSAFAKAWAEPADPQPAPEALANCGVARHVRGIDVSSYQGVIDWKRVRAAGVVFAFARVSDGLDVVDERFAANFAGMRRAGIRRGAYQHFRASVDPKRQAELLVRSVARFGRVDLPLVADVETDDGMSADEVRARLRFWLRRIERRTGRRSIVYTSPSMSATLGDAFGAYHLWVAHYEVDCPKLPDGWKHWRFWQRSSAGQVDGIKGSVDLDVFAGTARELRRFDRLGGPARLAGN